MCAARMGAQGPDCGSFFVLSLHLLGPQHCSVGPTSTDLFLPARQPSGLTVIPPEMSALGQRCEVTRSRSSTTLGRPGSPGPSAAPTWPLLGPPPPPPRHPPPRCLTASAGFEPSPRALPGPQFTRSRDTARRARRGAGPGPRGEGGKWGAAAGGAQHPPRPQRLFAQPRPAPRAGATPGARPLPAGGPGGVACEAPPPPPPPPPRSSPPPPDRRPPPLLRGATPARPRVASASARCAAETWRRAGSEPPRARR